MKTFILISGAWAGDWVWKPVTDRLRALGNAVYPVTLSGLDPADRGMDVSHIGFDVHVDDVQAVIREHDLRQVVVVGHGTSGVIAGIVADREPDRVLRVVYIEAFLPKNGKSVLEVFAEPLYSAERRLIAENNGRWPAPDVTLLTDAQDLSSDQARWLAENFVDHPGRPLIEPVLLNRPVEWEEQRAAYIVCAMEHFDGRLAPDVERLRAAPAWSFRTLDTGLWPMVSAPDALAEMLDEIAAENS